MFTTPEQFAAANKATVDSLLSLANTALASAERIAALNLNTARSVVEDSVSGAKALMGAKDVQEALSIQASLAQPNVEKAVAYSRSVYEISAQTQEELSKMVESQFGDFQKTVAGLLDQAAKSAPAGSDVAVAAVKSALAAANKATVDSLLSLANTALASAERIAALNLNTARSVMEDSVSGAKALMGAKDVQEALSIQASLAQPNVE